MNDRAGGGVALGSLSTFTTVDQATSVALESACLPVLSWICRGWGRNRSGNNEYCKQAGNKHSHDRLLSSVLVELGGSDFMNLRLRCIRLAMTFEPAASVVTSRKRETASPSVDVELIPLG